VAAFAAAALAAAGTLACSSVGVPEVPVEDGQRDPVLVAGRQVYIERCANCHGNDGGGGQGPSLASSALLEAYPSVGDQIAVVADGYNLMPSFSRTLTPEQISAVVRYTREIL